MADCDGNHRLEWKILALLMPVLVAAIAFDILWKLGGATLAWWGFIPVAFALLTIGPFVIGGRGPVNQWLRWDTLITLWAAWSWIDGNQSGTGWAMALWLMVVILNGMGVIALIWRDMMTRDIFNTTSFRWLLIVPAHGLSILIGWVNGWEWGVGCHAFLSLLWCCGTFPPASRIFGPVARRVEGQDVLITIDDGPDPEDTPTMLDLLDQYDRKAVFFVIGDKVRKFPELAREIVKRGHELGNHTMTHPAASMWGAGSVRTRREIEECNRAIEEVTGKKPRWYRAPAGHRNWFTHPVLKELGLDLVGWQKRGFDTVRGDIPSIVKCITKGARGGDILLLHEATPVAKEVLAEVLEELKQQNFANCD